MLKNLCLNKRKNKSAKFSKNLNALNISKNKGDLKKEFEILLKYLISKKGKGNDSILFCLNRLGP
jgi:hypothetical protein